MSRIFGLELLSCHYIYSCFCGSPKGQLNLHTHLLVCQSCWCLMKSSNQNNKLGWPVGPTLSSTMGVSEPWRVRLNQFNPTYIFLGGSHILFYRHHNYDSNDFSIKPLEHLVEHKKVVVAG